MGTPRSEIVPGRCNARNAFLSSLRRSRVASLAVGRPWVPATASYRPGHRWLVLGAPLPGRDCEVSVENWYGIS